MVPMILIGMERANRAKNTIRAMSGISTLWAVRTDMVGDRTYVTGLPEAPYVSPYGALALSIPYHTVSPK